MALDNHKPWMNKEHGIGGDGKWRKEWWPIATQANVLLLGEPPNKKELTKVITLSKEEMVHSTTHLRHQAFFMKWAKVWPSKIQI